MLPTSKEYFIRAGYTSKAAAYLLIGLFLAGVVVINVFSSLLHRYMPSSVVACAHSHENHRKEDDVETMSTDHGQTPASIVHTVRPEVNECSPLLPQADGGARCPCNNHHSDIPSHSNLLSASGGLSGSPPKPSFASRISERLLSLVGKDKDTCDTVGPCFGVSQTCGLECAKITNGTGDSAGIDASAIQPGHKINGPLEGTLDGASRETRPHPLVAHTPAQPSSTSTTAYSPPTPDAHHHDHHKTQHHHHVPQNAFLSIGLQTSLAIALHKLPEGFITYATNHTNPKLGWSVFIALVIHNITEGFAMSLPLYLALKSKVKAIIWSSLLGGISQPAGAGIAALWIWGSKKAHSQHLDPGNGDGIDGPSWAVYGGLFAATAGVMTNVALQLFSESLMLSHHRSLCIGFAIVGMGIMGMSFALTA